MFSLKNNAPIAKGFEGSIGQTGSAAAIGALPALSVNDLSFQTPNGQVLLENVSFSVESGSVLAIAGPNGAGKTTLLNLMSGLEKVNKGRVLVNGRCLSDLQPNQRAREIAVVCQQSTTDKRLHLSDYIALGQMPIWADYSQNDHATNLQQVLAVTSLSHLSDKPLGQLSGGELQRAHIARALAQRPRLLFLDEPTNHLDPDAKGRMLSLIAALGITVIMVVHDLVMIPEFATHAAFMKDAKLTAFGTVAEVLTPETVRNTFGVDYLLLPHAGRQIPALDIRKTTIQI